MSLDQKCSPTPPNPIDSTKHLSGDYESELSRILQAIKKTKSLSLSLFLSHRHTHTYNTIINQQFDPNL